VPAQPEAICTTGIKEPDLSFTAAEPAEPEAAPEITKQPLTIREPEAEPSTAERVEPEAVREIAEGTPASTGEVQAEPSTAEVAEPGAVPEITKEPPAAIGEPKGEPSTAERAEPEAVPEVAEGPPASIGEAEAGPSTAAPAEPKSVSETAEDSPASVGQVEAEPSAVEPAEPGALPEIAEEFSVTIGETQTESSTTKSAVPEAKLEIPEGPPAAIGETKAEPPAPVTPAIKPISTQPRRAVHRDRRGARRSLPGQAPAPGAPTFQDFRQAEAKLRLGLDPIRRSVQLSLVLSRPEGFPDPVSIDLGGPQTVSAFDETRYDDFDVTWTAELLADELRVSDPTHRVGWIRSARPLHLFAESDLDFVSVPAARPGIQHAVICRDPDAAAVSLAASRAGSPPLTPITGWSGIPPTWTVFSGYTPIQQISPLDDLRLRGLDIGSGAEIHLRGGLRIRAEHFAEGKPPSIFVEPFPSGCQVTIDRQPAFQGENGAWTTPDSENPGQHLIDVIGGSSLTYTIDADPGAARDWPIPEEALSSFGAPAPVSAALIGAYANPLARSAVLATEPAGSVVAIGPRAGLQPLGARPDIPAAVAAVPFDAAFIIVSWGRRRHQGRILCLGSPGPDRMGRRPDTNWVSTVIAAAARRLDVSPGDDTAKRAWRSAVTAARRARRLRT
jgi:hypothetical protein